MANPVFSFFEYRVLFKAIPLLLIVALFLVPKKVTCFFNIYVAIICLFFALYHGIGKTEKYGLVIHRNNFSNRKQPFWKYWIVPLVLFAFWCPANMQTRMPDFNPIYLFTQGLAFCLMAPLYIGMLTIYYPFINLVTLRITSIAGLGAALLNMYLQFIIYPDVLWWFGVLHLPLLVISLYGLMLSLKKPAIRHGANG